MTTAQAHRIFVTTQAFNSTDGMSPVMTLESGDTPPIEVNMTSALMNGTTVLTPSSPLMDGTSYHLGVVAVDEHGNTSSLVTFGPVAPRNDSLRAAVASLVLEGAQNVSGVHLLPIDAPVKATVHVSIAGSPLSAATAWFHLEHAGSGFSRNITGVTDASGQHVGLEVTSLMAWETSMAQNVGELTLTYGVIGVADDPVQQPWSSASGSMTTYGTVEVELSAPTIVQVAGDETWSIDLTVQEAMVEQTGVAPPLSLAYTVLDADGNSLGDGTLVPNAGSYVLESPSNEAAMVRFSLVNDGQPWVLVPGVHEVTLERTTDNGGIDPGNQSDNEQDGTDDPVEATELLPLVISDCTTRSFPRDATVEQNTQCVLRNPNLFPVTVSIDASAETLGLMRFDLVQGNGDIPAEGEQNVVWSMTTLRSLAEEKNTDFEATLAYAMTTASNASLSYDGSITLAWSLEEATSDDSTTDGSSGSNALIIGFGAVAIIAGLAVAVIVLRRPEDDEDFSEDDLDDMEYEPISTSSQDAVDLTTTSSLSQLKSTGASLEDVQPEVKERPSDALIMEASGVEPVVEDNDDEPASSEEDSSDGGINMDEFGTEWYEDEVGTWWYREAGQEDWSEYNE
jgi:hypothetical protein